LEEIKRVLASMPTCTTVERRDRAIVASAILTGARDGALASFRLKHIDMSAQTLFQDAREVRTKGRKTFTSIFFPVGHEPLEIVTKYVAMLRNDLGFSDDDPLFPSTQVGRGEDRGFVALGLSRISWTGAGPIRKIFRAAFDSAGLPYANPHSFRDTLVRLGQRLCRSPEEWKVWSQNLGHESEATTFVGYGHVPAHRHAEIMRALGAPRPDPLPAGLDIAALRAFVQSVEAINAAERAL
jgi:integrase